MAEHQKRVVICSAVRFMDSFLEPTDPSTKVLG
jgi:hypothetical protein